jgi:hypothetical protein
MEFLVFHFSVARNKHVMASLCESVVKEALVLERDSDSHWAQVWLGIETIFDFREGGEEKNPVLPAKTYNSDCSVHNTAGKGVLDNV